MFCSYSNKRPHKERNEMHLTNSTKVLSGIMAVVICLLCSEAKSTDRYTKQVSEEKPQCSSIFDRIFLTHLLNSPMRVFLLPAHEITSGRINYRCVAQSVTLRVSQMPSVLSTIFASVRKDTLEITPGASQFAIRSVRQILNVQHPKNVSAKQVTN